VPKPKDEAKPRQRVKYRHPETGELHTGHVHGRGHMGATVVGQDGAPVQVPHGDYLHHNEDEGADQERLKKAAVRHLGHGGQSRMATVAAATLLQIGGVPKPLELTADDLVLITNAILIKPEKLRVRKPPELVEVLEHLAQGELFGDLTTRDLREYAQHYGAAASQDGPTRMAKAVATALVIPSLPPPRQTWQFGSYVCEYRDGPSGMGYITIQHPQLPMAYHEAVGNNLAKAVKTARRLVDEFESGKVPHKGVFKRVAA